MYSPPRVDMLRGYNSRMSEYNVAVMRAQLPKLDRIALVRKVHPALIKAQEAADN
jgi:dTDP-4-amino-4,6-dideoxygalactose transaminase